MKLSSQHSHPFASIRGRGFTLLEVVLAMSVAMLLVGAATLGITGVQGEHRLQRLASKVETTARQTLLRAVTERRSLFVEIGPSSITVPGRSAKDGGKTEEVGEISLRRYGDRRFREVGRRGAIWEFGPGGICEPIALRIDNRDGRIELEFDPLTGVAVQKNIIVNGG